ncbi:ATP-dependent helicase [Candidatus Woesearchaeota archaeon]|nr:ATP-dependent helicase [Candidatus Woesearchaeota archaeon]
MIKFKEKPNTNTELINILNPVVKKWFKSKFDSFCLPQQYAIMDIHCRKNVLVSAPTGSGKTLTAFLAILNELVDSALKNKLEDKIYCVYISPLKALNSDIQFNLLEPLKEIEKIAGKELGIRVAVRTGDTTQSEKSKMLKKPPHILITTPESLSIVLSSPKFIEHLKKVDWCIIDEIHALAENKRGVHLSLSMERLENLSGHMCRVGLSATVAPLKEVAGFLVGPKRDCEIVDVQFIKEMDLQVLSPVDNLVDVDHAVLHYKMYELIDKLIHEHKTTLIFTNTRAATERIVDYLKDKFPKRYTDNIGAHHGSLGKQKRLQIENRLRAGSLKAVVCSTSLELGIDIGYIDLVICLGSPKSVARFLQRAGRAGHKLHEKVKGRIIVMDRDDLIECAVLLKSAVEKKIDKLHIPTGALDVLAQQIAGIAVEQVWDEKELYQMIKKSYCYRDLTKKDFNEVLDYLAGKFVDLEDRYIYAKIWRNEGKLGKRGRLARVIYMMNSGTIPDESFITVKIGDQTIGKLDEAFLEKMKPGDVFVLGGDTYVFKFSRGMVAQVAATSNRPPTVPRWVSEMLPLSFDLALEVGKLRRLSFERFNSKKSKKEILQWLHKYLYVDTKAAKAIYEYFREQYDYSKQLPNDKLILIEHFNDDREKKIIFHSLYGRRVNDCLSRAIAYIISRNEHRDVEIGINDNGFYLSGDKRVNPMKAFKLLKADKLDLLMELAIDKSEVFKRRFRHCATRALMILRNYLGKKKNVGRQQVSSMILMSALKRISKDFSILKETRREVLEDLMDIENTKKVIKDIESKKIRVVEINTRIPTPFAFNLAVQGYADIMKIEDKHEFLKRMHHHVLAKIGLNKDADKEILEKYKAQEPKDYNELFEEMEQKELTEKEQEYKDLRQMIWNLKKVPLFAKEELIKLIDGADSIRPDVLKAIEKHKKTIKKTWPKKLQHIIFTRLEEIA